VFGFLLFFLPLILFKGTGEKIFKEAFQVDAPAVKSVEMAETKANIDAPAAMMPLSPPSLSRTKLLWLNDLK